MMTEYPLVSICIPTFNASLFLEETLNSLANQTYPNIEYIVLDNRSDDDTVEIAKRVLGEKNNFKLILNEKNIGGEANFNKAFEVAKGDFVSIYHADDIYERTIVEESASFLISNTQVGGVTTLGRIIDESSRPTGFHYSLPEELEKRGDIFTFEELFNSILMHGNSFLICPSAMVRTKLAKELGGFEFHRFRSSSDLGLWLAIAKNSSFGIIKKNLINYRVHEGQGSQTLIRLNTKIPDVVKTVKFYGNFLKDLPDSYHQFISEQILFTCIRRIRMKKYTWNGTLLKQFRKEFFLGGVHFSLKTILHILLYVLITIDNRVKSFSFLRTIFKIRGR